MWDWFFGSDEVGEVDETDGQTDDQVLAECLTEGLWDDMLDQEEEPTDEQYHGLWDLQRVTTG